MALVEMPVAGKSPAQDDIVMFVTSLKKLNSRAATEEGIRDILERKKKNKFMLGGFLAKLQMNPAWWDNSYANFKDYIESVLGIGYWKAMYCVRIYRKLCTLGVPWSDFGGIGWAKVNLLLEVVAKETVKEWVEKAQAMNALSLKAAVGAALKAQAGTGEEPKEAASVVTITFKAHPDQKEVITQALEKTKTAIPTQVQTVALEGICQEYLGAGISFSDWHQALAYARKHSDDPSAFVQEVVAEVESLCPELDITCEIDIKQS